MPGRDNNEKESKALHSLLKTHIYSNQERLNDELRLVLQATYSSRELQEGNWNPMLTIMLKRQLHAFAKDVFINQERKLGARRRSDTVLVSTINDADQGSADVAFRTPLAPYEKSKSLGFGGSMVARLKLKGIDGRAPPGVEPAA
ncbi:unnamed protein product [Lupinus luteus]|uniref:Uncharacterized protein n=1 Tax=Lupinus luteus TaxID=3873 RepID=A0AAV1VYT4_LUPLU